MARHRHTIAEKFLRNLCGAFERRTAGKQPAVQMFDNSKEKLHAPRGVSHGVPG
jgi:hypothetical protein